MTLCLPCSFRCNVYVNVIPAVDVADVQSLIATRLKNPYNDPSGLLKLWADAENIHTTPVGRKQFSTETDNS